MNLFKLLLIVFFGGIVFISCTQKNTDASNTENTTPPETLVTIGFPSDTITLNDQITLNATATYLLSSGVKANATGYITSMSIKPMDRISRGQTLFVLQTKEARALGNTINNLDPSFRFSGVTKVVSPSSGYVQVLNHQTGDYVQDGEVLATIADASSFGFVMNVPYEYNQYINIGGRLDVQLPDGRTLQGIISKIIPTVSPASQTQQVLIKVADKNIPENLIASVILIKGKAVGLCVPKSAVLTDDAQSEFWVMKMSTPHTAIKTPITKGIETDKWVEIKSGNISIHDQIIIGGNFGLSDTAQVKIQK